MLEGTAAPHLMQIDSDTLPELPSHKINLYGGNDGKGQIVDALVDLVRQNFAKMGGAHLRAVS